MVQHRPIQELYSRLRLRMMRQTELFLEEGIRNPRLGVRIPRMVAGNGRFSPRFALTFWELALAATPDVATAGAEKTVKKVYNLPLNGSQE